MTKIVYEHKQTSAQKKLTEVEAARAELKYKQEKDEYDAKKREEKTAAESAKKERQSRGEYTFWEKFGLMIIGAAIFLTGFMSLSVIGSAILCFVVGAALAAIGFFKMKKIKAKIECIKEQQREEMNNSYTVCSACGATTHSGKICEYCGSKLG